MRWVPAGTVKGRSKYVLFYVPMTSPVSTTFAGEPWAHPCRANINTSRPAAAISLLIVFKEILTPQPGPCVQQEPQTVAAHYFPASVAGSPADAGWGEQKGAPSFV